MYFYVFVLLAVSAGAECSLSRTADEVSYVSGLPVEEACDAQSLLQLRHAGPGAAAAPEKSAKKGQTAERQAARNAAAAPLFDLASPGAKFCRIGGVLPYWTVIGEDRDVAIACSHDASICEEFQAVAEQNCGMTLQSTFCDLEHIRPTHVGAMVPRDYSAGCSYVSEGRQSLDEYTSFGTTCELTATQQACEDACSSYPHCAGYAFLARTSHCVLSTAGACPPGLKEAALLQRGWTRSLLQELRSGDRVVDERAALKLWPQLGSDYRKCSDSTGHRIDPQVSDCGSRMIDITLIGKEVEGQYDLKSGKGAAVWMADEDKPLSLRYKKIAKVDGMDLDLLVKNMTADYDPGIKKVVQGIKDQFGVVSVRSNRAHSISFEIVKSGTNTPIRLPEVPITLYDLDGAKGCAMRESVYTSGYIYGKIGSHLANVPGGYRNTFPPEMGTEASVDSPESPETLTELQKSISAGFVFANTASFTIEFDASFGFADTYPDLETPVHACGTDTHARWMFFSMVKLPCEGSYLPSAQSTPEGHPVATVNSQEDCQELAELNSHPHYSFEPTQKKCFTSAKCYEPVDTTGGDNQPWRIHVALWPKHPKTNVACRPTAGAPSVHSELKCQELAIERGHRFFSFLEATKQCITSSECDTPGKDPEYPNAQADPWHIREEPWLDFEPHNQICEGEDIWEEEPSQWWCQRRARERGHAFYSWSPVLGMCKTTQTCTKPVPTPPDNEWRIHIELWPLNGDPGDGLCGAGFLEKISLGDAADCQSLCAATEDCKHYCYLDGGSEGYCRTYGGNCGSDGKTGGVTPADSYTCYDKPVGQEPPSRPMVGIFGYATKYETFVKSSSKCEGTTGRSSSGKGFVFHGHHLLCEDFERNNDFLLFQVA